MAAIFNYKINLNDLDLNAFEKQSIEEKGTTIIFEGLFTSLLSAKYNEGIKGAVRKSLTRILAKLDDADEETGTIELDASEVDLLKEVFNDETKVPVNVTRLFSLYEKEVEKTAKQIN